MIDCIIVGAGPAGLSAAISSAENGLHVTVIDEFMKPGGRLLGQLHEEPNRVWWNGIEEARELYDKAAKLPISIHLETSVHHIEKLNGEWFVYTNKGIYNSKSLLIATGATERALPIPGWTLPGVMSIGAAQVMTNVHRVKPGHQGIIIGVNVLAMAIARELKLAGVDLKGIVLPPNNLLTKGQSEPAEVFQSLLHLTNLAPSALLKMSGYLSRKLPLIQKVAVGFYPKSGFKVWGIPIQLRRAVIEIIGDEKVEAVKVVDLTPSGEIIKDSEQTITVDFVCIAGGLYPLVELASVLGCPFKYLESLGGHVPVHNNRMQTPVKGLYVAGNITGIESAKVAMSQGHLAGLSMAYDNGHFVDAIIIDKAIANVELTRQNALIQFHPEIQQGREKMAEIAKDFSDEPPSVRGTAI